MKAEEILKLDIKKELVNLLDEKFIFERKAFPYMVNDREIYVAIVNPNDINTEMHIKSISRRRVVLTKISSDEFYLLVRRYFGIGAGMFSEVEKPTITFEKDFNIDDSKESAEVVQFVNKVLQDAYNKGATDVHLEPTKDDTLLRYRIDGVLHNISIPKSIQNVYLAVVSRIKIMAEMDIAEKRLPQDGRIKIKSKGEDTELRISVIPTINGESIVIRILANQKREMDLEKLGMSPKILRDFKDLISKPNGIILVTGPTGSGKTTTLFSAIKEINDGSQKILTIEDPVEYQLDGVSQIQAKSEIGFDFATGLRAILRHDPDIIMIGEIRDKETAEIAIRSSLTGHLVFATLHTNDSISSVTRLIDMGIEPYLITSSLVGVLAQRLVRKICPYCKTEKILDNGKKTWYGKGCDYCFHTGYKGRTSIHELYIIDDITKKDILTGKSNFEIKKNQVDKGWKTLKDDGMDKAEIGETTFEEVIKVAW
ncbi:MAG: type II/IV secretion system protein [Fusobacteriaceae bacterium]|jgi:type II secretory ATPase GspE/PulE/Tfp pilus assembly ATPase PilB-like protein|nr:type II/IV secretion system protein [Fusobacteriaceae bacterium]MBU9918255.1 GspE/PulE family protein [Fusobacteriaceae bacterium]